MHDLHIYNYNNLWDKIAAAMTPLKCTPCYPQVSYLEEYIEIPILKI
jgi:hypothetical protein